MRIKKIFFVIIIFLLFFTSLYNIISRIKWENNKKFFVIDIDYFLINDKSLKRIKTDLNNGLFFSLNYNFFLDNYNSFLNKEVVLKIDKDKRYDFLQISEFVKSCSDKIFSIIFSPQNTSCLESKEFYGISVKKITNQELKLLLEKNNFVKLNFEFGGEEIFSKKTVSLRSFILDLNINRELKITQQKDLAVLKIRKAIFERSCNLIYIIPSEYLSYDENIKLIKDILKNFVIRNNFFELRTFRTISFGRINNILVLFIAIIVPLMIYKNISFNDIKLKQEVVYIKTNFLMLFLGIFIWGFMQGYEYIVLEKKIMGAKIMFFLPIILSPFFVFDRTELKKLSEYEVKLRDIFVILSLIIIFAYILLRTGNVGKEFVLRYELYFREFIEKRILFRPRFKEIFFAQPLFLFSLYLMKKYNKILLTKILFCVSILSQVSIINTFLHIHTPIHLCFLRSIIGIFLGLLIGEIIIFIFEKINMKKI